MALVNAAPATANKPAPTVSIRESCTLLSEMPGMYVRPRCDLPANAVRHDSTSATLLLMACPTASPYTGGATGRVYSAPALVVISRASILLRDRSLLTNGASASVHQSLTVFAIVSKSVSYTVVSLFAYITHTTIFPESDMLIVTRIVFSAGMNAIRSPLFLLHAVRCCFVWYKGAVHVAWEPHFYGASVPAAIMNITREFESVKFPFLGIKIPPCGGYPLLQQENAI